MLKEFKLLSTVFHEKLRVQCLLGTRPAMYQGQSSTAQRPRIDLDKRFLPRLNTTKA